MKNAVHAMIRQAFVFAALATLITTSAPAQDIVPKEGDIKVTKRPYSPYAGRSFPTRVLWGETHLHTNLSLDARGFGVTLGPEEAFRFARGDELSQEIRKEPRAC